MNNIWLEKFAFCGGRLSICIFVQNTYVPSYEPAGKPIHQVVDELASDNEYWAEMFMEGWQDMVTNRIGPIYLAMQITQK